MTNFHEPISIWKLTDLDAVVTFWAKAPRWTAPTEVEMLCQRRHCIVHMSTCNANTTDFRNLRAEGAV